jgi:thiosulfate reductase cytochrome b subunit
MATYAQTVRRGLPRQPGGEPWPPAAAVESAPVPAEAAAGAVVLPAAVTAETAAAQPTSETMTPSAEPLGADGSLRAPASAAAVGGARTIRRGLPRVPGGEPWPPPVSVAVAVAAASVPLHPSPVLADRPDSRAQVTDEPRVPEAPASPTAGARALRRGLPRVPGGEPWPQAGFAPTAAPTELPVEAGIAEPVAVTEVADAELVTRQDVAAPAAASVVPAMDLSKPLPFTRTVFPGRAAVAFERQRLSGQVATTPEPERIGPFTRLQWAGAVIVGGAGLLFAAGMAVVAVRWLLSLEPMQEFLTAYPGEYELPEGAPVGIPPWLGWQHFFNVFLIVLIIRSGLQVRTEKRPSVFWSPRNNGKRKISLNLWFHQSLDLLWVTNGVIFVVLLFVTGQWMKIVPTSWAVFPNAISAGLQYVSLDWPTENGWVNYNSLQQLAYFATVFIAAPLAIATGVRMSGIWPKNATALNKAYPVEWARAIHFPVMLYFVAFIFVHVALVFATNALRNLNHMYASQDAINWTGFWIFVASLGVIAAGWVAARPLVLAPIARLFGKVSGR